MDFDKVVPEWKAQGAEPPESLKTSGFTAGYKPPADYFNWFWYRVSQCLSELHTKLANISDVADAEKSVKYASTAGTANKTKGTITVRLNGGETEGTDMFTFDGSAGKSVNITPAKIGAADKSAAPFMATYGTTTGAEIEAAYQAGRQVLVKTDDGYIGVLFAKTSGTSAAYFFMAGDKIYRYSNNAWADITASYGFTPAAHTHKSSEITTVADTAYTSMKIRGQSLNSAETTPTLNGTIAWVYG